jgi:hypothetical protein
MIKGVENSGVQHEPEFSMGYANDVMTPNSNFSLASYPGTFNNVRPSNCFCSTYATKTSEQSPSSDAKAAKQTHF